MRKAKGNRRRLIGSIYMTVLSRRPTPEEIAAAVQYIRTTDINTRQAVTDLTWALINTKEFLYRH